MKESFHFWARKEYRRQIGHAPHDYYTTSGVLEAIECFQKGTLAEHEKAIFGRVIDGELA